MKLLITGGAGFIGSHLAGRLLADGHEVAAFDSLDPQVHGNADRPRDLDAGARFVRGDVRDRAALLAVVREAEAIFHLASAVGVGQSQYRIAHYVEVNAGGTANLLDVLANERHAVRKLIVAASMSSYGEGCYACAACGPVRPPLRDAAMIEAHGWEPPCPRCAGPLEPRPTPEEARRHVNSVYALTKRDTEDLALVFGRSYGLPVVALRFFNVYGPRQSLSNPYTGVAAIFLSRLKNGRPPVVYEDGLQTRDFVSVHDVTEACVRALECDAARCDSFNVGSGEPQSIAGVARAIGRALGRQIEPEITGRFRTGDVRQCYADTSRIERVLGFRPRVGFEEGLAELVAWSATAEAVDRFDQAAAELQRRGLA